MGTIHSFMQLLWVIPSAVIAKTNDTKCQSMCFHCVNLRHIYHRKCQCCSEFLYKPNKCAPDNSRQAEMSLEPIWSSTRLHTNKPPSSYLPRAMFPSWLPTAGTNTLHSWCLLLFFFYIDFNMQYQQSFIALAAWWCLKWELNIGRSILTREETDFLQWDTSIISNVGCENGFTECNQMGKCTQNNYDLKCFDILSCYISLLTV